MMQSKTAKHVHSFVFLIHWKQNEKHKHKKKLYETSSKQLNSVIIINLNLSLILFIIFCASPRTFFSSLLSQQTNNIDQALLLPPLNSHFAVCKSKAFIYVQNTEKKSFFQQSKAKSLKSEESWSWVYI